MTDQFSETTKQGMSFYRQLLTCLCICCSVFLVAYLWDSYTSQAANVRVQTITPITEQVSALSSGVRIKKIQEVEVGERAVGMNPELTDSERATFLPDPEPSTWRKLTLEMIKPNGKRLDITLLRPLSWIGESQADIGATIYLDLPEMGAQGFAKVRNIEPCPPIKRGKGNVITGTFHHEAANTIDLYVEGLSKPIGCTDNHPFWSVTQNEFVEAGKLLPGEELQLYNGQNAKVVQILPRPGPEWVHNIEVLNEHVYRVTDWGILVHNNCLRNRMEKENIPKPANLKNPQAHHDFPQKFRVDFLAAGIDIDNPKYGRWVEGSPEGNHQRWTHEYNKIWENFFDDHRGKEPKELKKLIEAKRQELINDPRFQ